MPQFPQPPRPVDAVVFDLDGVLVDSEDLWGVVEERVVTDFGHPWDPSIRDELLGTGPLESAVIIADHLRAAVPADGRPRRSLHADVVAERMLAISEEVFAEGVPLAGGVLEVLGALHGRIPLAVATNSRRALAVHSVGGNGLDCYFDAVVTADDVDRHKPAPDPYLEACRRVCARPGHSVGIDDSHPGMTSAKAAGLFVIGCGPAHTAGSPADAVIGALADLDPRLLLAG